jgi:NADH-quinone oxidoreductase subunit G
MVLAASTAFEKEGTFVNHAGVMQSFKRAVKPNSDMRTELQIAHELLGNTNLVSISAIRKEIVTELPEFAVLSEIQEHNLTQRIELTTV